MNKLQSELDLFLEGVISRHGSRVESLHEQAQGKALLESFVNEARVAFSLIEHQINRNSRVLEVGAGLCLLSLFLKQQGYDVVALEPLANGFGFFEKMQKYILHEFENLELTVLSKTVEQLDPSEDGRFDLVFSSNVLEHIPQLGEAFRAMKLVLNDDGKMIHGCPNYLVPYEPHYGLPVFFWFPSLTSAIWKKRISASSEVWGSLNFVTYFQIKRLARQVKCSAYFRPNLTYLAFVRIHNDPVFRERHENTIVGKLFFFLEYTGTLKLTKFLPSWASTPMVFELSKLNHGGGL